MVLSFCDLAVAMKTSQLVVIGRNSEAEIRLDSLDNGFNSVIGA